MLPTTERNIESSSRNRPEFCFCFLSAIRWFVGSNNDLPLPVRRMKVNIDANVRRPQMRDDSGLLSSHSQHASPAPASVGRVSRQITDEVRVNVGRRLSLLAAPRSESISGGITSLRLFRDPFRDIGYRYEIIGEALAHGGFADVFKVRDLYTNEIRAAKRVPKDQISDNSLLRRELELLLTLDHPNVVRLFEWFESTESIWLIQEMCTGGEVLSLVGNCTSREALNVTRQILLGLAYLHDRGVIHRDVKLENCMFQSAEKESVVKIIDFGLAGIVRQLVTPPEKRDGSRGATPASQTGRAGTAIYLAPELTISGKVIKYTPKCDMWSLGILMHILLTGEHPFWDKRTPFNDVAMMKRILEKPVDVHSISPETAADLVSKLLVVDVDSRLSAHEALMHPCMRVSAFLGSELHLKLMTNLRSYKRFRPIERVVLTILAYHSRDDALREVFSLLDTDMNGVLSKQEIVTGMNRLGLMLPQDFDEILDSIDADGSGEIDFTEFIAAGLSADQVRDESLIDCAFGWLSSEHSGQISLKDLQAVVSSYDAESTIQQYASDGHVYLTRSDFSRLISDIAHIKESDGSEDSPVSLAKTQSRRRLSWDEQSGVPRISFPNPFRTLSDNPLKRADSSR